MFSQDSDASNLSWGSAKRKSMIKNPDSAQKKKKVDSNLAYITVVTADNGTEECKGFLLNIDGFTEKKVAQAMFDRRSDKKSLEFVTAIEAGQHVLLEILNPETGAIWENANGYAMKGLFFMWNPPTDDDSGDPELTPENLQGKYIIVVICLCHDARSF